MQGIFIFYNSIAKTTFPFVIPCFLCNDAPYILLLFPPLKQKEQQDPKEWTEVQAQAEDNLHGTGWCKESDLLSSIPSFSSDTQTKNCQHKNVTSSQTTKTAGYHLNSTFMPVLIYLHIK